MKLRRLGAAIALALATTSCTNGCNGNAQSMGDAAIALQPLPPARIEIYVVDETTRALAARARDAPFPALPDGTDLQTPREHEATLAKFVASVTPPIGFRFLVGVRSTDDSFARTFLVAATPALGADHVGRVDTIDAGAHVVAYTLDDEGRAALDALDGKRIAIVVDDRVVASSYRPSFGILPATTSAKK